MVTSAVTLVNLTPGAGASKTRDEIVRRERYHLRGIGWAQSIVAESVENCRRGLEKMAAKVAHPESIVETQWVADHMEGSNVRLVEVDVDLGAYGEGHIAGGSVASADGIPKPTRGPRNQSC